MLQHRAPSTAQGNTWSIPGGALDHGETPLQAALREGAEEVCLPAGCAEGDDPLVVVRELAVLTDHGAWRYTTVVADVMGDFEPARPPGDYESLAVEWVRVGDVADGERRLHPAFADAWGTLREMITRADRPTTGINPYPEATQEDGTDIEGA